MKIPFHNLREAVNYHLYCPLCQDKMLINDRYVETRKDWYDGQQSTRFVWGINDTEIFADLDTNQVEINSKYYRADYGVGEYVGQTSSKYPSFSSKFPANGTMYEGLGLNCGSCKRYSYIVKMLIDIETQLITNIELNSEMIRIKDHKGNIHQIKNVYTLEKTEYIRSLSTSDGDGPDPISFPLIPLDLSDPWKTIDRLKTLTLFS